MEEEFDKIEKELEEKTQNLAQFREEMRTRRQDEGIEQLNPFKTHGQDSIDKKLNQLYSEVPEGQAAVCDDARVN